jgi:hypothetical protein
MYSAVWCGIQYTFSCTVNIVRDRGGWGEHYLLSNPICVLRYSLFCGVQYVLWCTIYVARYSMSCGVQYSLCYGVKYMLRCTILFWCTVCFVVNSVCWGLQNMLLLYSTGCGIQYMCWCTVHAVVCTMLCDEQRFLFQTDAQPPRPGQTVGWSDDWVHRLLNSAMTRVTNPCGAMTRITTPCGNMTRVTSSRRNHL